MPRAVSAVSQRAQRRRIPRRKLSPAVRSDLGCDGVGGQAAYSAPAAARSATLRRPAPGIRERALAPAWGPEKRNGGQRAAADRNPKLVAVAATRARACGPR